ncbi:FAD-binding oxidoreductase [Actinoplanes sp. NPDC051513]|uniref:FAD-binding oxidoreductase n=1 Tax=Actinoplanes sp. NPDC051513 TaxID=3363908 RepID=UPI0037A1BFB7
MTTTSLAGALRPQMTGTVLTAEDAGFGPATQLWNGRIGRRPALVVAPADAADVAAAVTFARERGLAVSVRGGGHNIAGTALADGGLAIDMSGFRDVSVDPVERTATVGGGCRLGDVDRATQAHGLATPLGFISRVGVAGLTLGGGLGVLTRRFGWTVDNLVAAEVVTADGAVRETSRDAEPDLFWALRGAGANLGVVTRFTYRLHRVGPDVYGGLIAWPFERAAEVMDGYRAFTATAPRELAVWFMLLTAPPEPFVPAEWHGRKLCAMAVCYSGDPGDGDEVVAPLRALGEPALDLLSPAPYTQIQSYLDDTEPEGMHYDWRTEYAGELTGDLLATMRDLFADCPAPMADIGLLHLAGALNEHADDDGAVGNRDARYVMGVKGMWPPGEPQAARFREWVAAAGDRIRPHGLGRTYINFQGPDEADDRVRASYGANYPRLLAIKRRYDPDNVFRSNRNIRP